VPAQLTLRQLSYFVAVAEECHFRRAAARLHVSQPPLTQRIQALERDLGVQLFTRSGGHVELTEAGHVVLREAQATLAQAERVREVARQVGQGEAGRLRVSVVISAPFVPGFSEATHAFQRDNPAVVLEMAENTARTSIEALRQRKVDMCVVRKVAPELTGVEQILIGNDQLMLVLPSTHPLAAADKVALRDIAEERFIQFATEHSIGLHRHVTELWTRAGLVPRTTQSAQNGLALLALVSAGFGNAILPSTLRNINMPKVVWKTIDMDEQLTASPLMLVYRADGQNEKVQRRFIEYIKRFCPSAT
jgi:DNA-binding transcriptional LysR family regulator